VKNLLRTCLVYAITLFLSPFLPAPDKNIAKVPRAEELKLGYDKAWDIKIEKQENRSGPSI
jgi:hypothetical protein